MRSFARTLIALFLVVMASNAFAQQPTPSSVPAAIGVHVACFSPQRAFAESADGKAAVARLKALQDDRARAIDEKNKALQAQEQALERSSSVLSDAVRAQRTSEVARFRLDVQRFIEDAQAEVQGAQREAESAFVVKLKPALFKVAKDRGLQIVFNVDDGQMAWFDPTLDITAEVLKELAVK